MHAWVPSSCHPLQHFKGHGLVVILSSLISTPYILLSPQDFTLTPHMLTPDTIAASVARAAQQKLGVPKETKATAFWEQAETLKRMAAAADGTNAKLTFEKDELMAQASVADCFCCCGYCEVIVASRRFALHGTAMATAADCPLFECTQGRAVAGARPWRGQVSHAVCIIRAAVLNDALIATTQ